ncbi:helix-turn-helix domain-containing protein [Hydrogenophaga sp. ANAO-22]|uniref:helix-turn-helix domain-containing protein n=1 Tax=Hydrogenophaga sp. ANAO-22 TaxID=3166645 RepID=UPI0036D3E208
MRSHASPREPLLTPREASTYLCVPTTTLAVWRSTGRVKLPYVKVGGHVRYRLEDIESFLNRGGDAATSENEAESQMQTGNAAEHLTVAKNARSRRALRFSQGSCLCALCHRSFATSSSP